MTQERPPDPTKQQLLNAACGCTFMWHMNETPDLAHLVALGLLHKEPLGIGARYTATDAGRYVAEVIDDHAWPRRLAYSPRITSPSP